MFQMDDEYLNGYAALCGQAASCVYMSLCRHANKGQQAWPSVELLGVEHAMSKSTVLRSIKVLERWGIIEVVRSKNEKTKRQNPNVYVLADKTYWRSKPGVTREPGAGCQIKTEPGVKIASKPGVTTVPEGNTERRKHREGRELASLSKREQMENYGFTTS
jgi:hypothetical protein